MSNLFESSGEISPDHPALPGHFPGNPVVPGVALLTEVLRAVERAFGPGASVAGLPAVKFTAPLRPGEPFRIRLERTGGTVRFAIVRGETAIASGSLRIAGGEAA